MNRNSISRWFVFERILFSLYHKRNIKTIKAYICVGLALVPNIYMILFMSSQTDYITQKIFESETFWQDFITLTLNIFPLVSIFLGGTLISQDFSKGTAQLIYSSIPRKRNLLSTIRFLMIHVLILQLISFIVFNIEGLWILGKLVPPYLFLVGFLYAYFHSLFYLSFAFILSSLLRNTIIALVVPLLYFMFAALFIQMDMELLAINYYTNIISDRVLIYIWIGMIHVYPELILSIVVLLSIPIVLLLISIYGFEIIEIRYN